MPVQVRPDLLGPEEVESPNPNGLGDVGLVPDSAEAKLLALLEATIREKRDQVVALEAERDAVNRRLLEARAAAKAYDDMRKRALGEPLKKLGRPPGRKPGPNEARPQRAPVSAERIEAAKADILRYSEDHDEFSQIEIRTMPGASVTNSGAIAYVFEALRQDDFIRWARKKGQRQMFRLTRSAAAAVKQ
jgi:hypothetical protein